MRTLTQRLKSTVGPNTTPSLHTSHTSTQGNHLPPPTTLPPLSATLRPAAIVKDPPSFSPAMAFLRFTGRQSPARHESDTHKYFVSTRPGRPQSVLSDETLVSRSTIVSADKVAGRRRKFGDKLRSLLRGDRDKAKADKAKVASHTATLPNTSPVSSCVPKKAAVAAAVVPTTAAPTASPSPSPSSACSDGFMFWHDPSDNLTPVTSHESFASTDLSFEDTDVLEQLAEVPRCSNRISKSTSQSSMASQLTIPNSVSCTSQLSAIAVSAFSDSGSDSGMSDSATCFGAEELDFDAKDAYNLGDWGLPRALTDGYSDSEDEDDRSASSLAGCGTRW